MIRYLRPDDDPYAISAIYEESWKHAYRGIIPQDYLDSVPRGKWAGNFDPSERSALVCEEDGELIGTATIAPSRWDRYPDCGEVISLYLKPGSAGKGHGRELMEYALNELRKRGYTRVILWVLKENTNARGFYEHLGFTCTGDSTEGRIGGKLLTEVCYRIDLPDRTGTEQGKETQ